MPGPKCRAVVSEDLRQLQLACRTRTLRMHVHRALPGGCPAGIQQFQRRGGIGQVLARQVKVPCGRTQVAVTHEPLDGVHVDPAFQHVRGKGMAQRVDAAALADASLVLGTMKDAVHGVLA